MKTVRRHNGQAFVDLRASLTRGDLHEQAQAIAEAYGQWESPPVTLANGTRMSSGYVLWIPESRPAQLSTDGLMPGDVPSLPPELDLRALRDDLDPQIDEQPPIVALLSRCLQPAAGGATLNHRPRRPPRTRA